MRELTSRGWIAAKGLVFSAIACATGGLLLLDQPSVRTAALLAVLVWASCRFYYFLFYALEKYVDPGSRYAGVLALLVRLFARRGGGAQR